MKLFIALVAALASPLSALAGAGMSSKIYTEFENNPIVFGAQTRSADQPSLPDIPVDVTFFAVVPDVIADIKKQGIDVRSISTRFNRGGFVVHTLAQVEYLKSLPSVQYIKPAIRPVTRAGSVTSQAVRGHGVTPFQGVPFNLTGDGVSVAILSDSLSSAGARDLTVDPSMHDTLWPSIGVVTGLTAQKTGDLPAEVYNAWNDADYTNTDEGAGMAELVHDIAPGASIMFHSVGYYSTDFAEGIDHLCSPETQAIDIPYWPSRTGNVLDYSHGLDGSLMGLDADIVVDDIFFFDSLVFQKDVIAAAADTCWDNGKMYFSAAGNDGDYGFATTYSNNYMMRSLSSNGKTLDKGHNWGGESFIDDGFGITLGPRQKVYVALYWNQPALSMQTDKVNPPLIDFDLVARDSTGALVSGSVSTELQNNGEYSADPIELITLENLDYTAKTYDLNVYHASGEYTFIPQTSGKRIELKLSFFVTDSGLEDGYPTFEYAPNSHVIAGQNVSEKVISVAAVRYSDTPAFTGSSLSTSIVPEDFSTRGGAITTQFDSAGNYITATANKPELAAIDGANTTFFGRQYNDGDLHPNFFGTSAAAPNAAALAALYMQAANADPYTNAELLDVMKCTAVDAAGGRASAGWDDVTGAGLAMLSVPAFSVRSVVAAPDELKTITLTPAPGAADIDHFTVVQTGGLSTVDITTGSNSFTLDTTGISSASFYVSTVSACGARYGATIDVTVNNDQVAPLALISTGYKEGLNPFALSGEGSYDPEGPIASYSWSQLSGPSATLSADGIEATVTPSRFGTYEFQLLATDMAGNIGKAIRSIVVKPAQSPVFIYSQLQDKYTVGKPATFAIEAHHPTDESLSPTLSAVGLINAGKVTISEASPAVKNKKVFTLDTSQAGEIQIALTAVTPTGGVATKIVIVKIVEDVGSSGGSGGGALFYILFLLPLLAARKAK